MERKTTGRRKRKNMTDKQILEEVYKMCCNPFERCDIKSFIEEEWQKADEEANPPRFSE